MGMERNISPLSIKRPSELAWGQYYGLCLQIYLLFIRVGHWQQLSGHLALISWNVSEPRCGDRYFYSPQIRTLGQSNTLCLFQLRWSQAFVGRLYLRRKVINKNTNPPFWLNRKYFGEHSKLDSERTRTKVRVTERCDTQPSGRSRGPKDWDLDGKGHWMPKYIL